MDWILSYLLFALLGLPAVIFLCLRPISGKPWRWPFAVAGAVLFVLLWYAFGLKPDDHGTDMDVESFAETPVQYQGRFMPVDTAARTTLRLIRGRETVEAPDGEKLHAIDWLLWVMAKPRAASELPVFRIDHPEVRSLFGIPADRKYYSYAELMPGLEQVEGAIGTLPDDTDEYSVYEQQLAKTLQAIHRYNLLVSSFHTGINRPDIDALELVKIYRDWDAVLRAAADHLSAQQRGETPGEAERRFMEVLRTIVPLFQLMADPENRLAVIPPQDPERATDETVAGERWLTIGGSLTDTLKTGGASTALYAYADLILAYADADADAFDDAVRRIHAATRPHAPVGRIALEEGFNRTAPFFAGLVIYLAGLPLIFFSWIPREGRSAVPEGFRQTAFWMFVFAFLLHSGALLARMIIMDRPAPVTNLYSSAVFIGWAACGLGLLLEQLYRNSFGILISGVVGFGTLVIAHGLGGSGDTMEAMRAVLDSNFWLATHVVTITLGYTPMFIAGLLGMVYIVRGLLFKGFDRSAARELTRMTYGVLAFALILSFIGTFLGGVWADQSWGRFWGWDPKENGALMIVLWAALILHARLAGLVRERGLMNLAIVGSMITAWSWFGTNQLGIGLHSYGFTDAGHFWLMTFWASQLFFIALGLIPTRFWRSRDTLFIRNPANTRGGT